MGCSQGTEVATATTTEVAALLKFAALFFFDLEDRWGIDPFWFLYAYKA